MISSDTTGSLASVEHLDVFPNEALGPFKLGDSFWTVTEVLKNYRSTFRVVDISWEEENPASSTILLKLDGYITLIFPSTPPPCPQLLQRIDIDFTIPSSSKPSSSSITAIPSLSTPSSSSSSTVKKSQPRFTYAGQTLHSAQAPLSKNRVSTLFGPTFEPKNRHGEEDSRGRVTCYPGIGFEWSPATGSSSKDANGDTHTIGRPKSKSNGKTLPTSQHEYGRTGLSEEVGSSPSIGKITIFQARPDHSHTANLETMSRDPLVKVSTEEGQEDEWKFVPNGVMQGSLRLCQITPGKCITLYFHTHSGDRGNDNNNNNNNNNNNPYPIELHRTLAQDLLLDLGPPARKYTKQDGRFEGMYRADPASSPGRDRGKGRKDKNGKEKGKGGKGGKVWWNYFHLGLDFLVDEAEAGVVVKVMVHSNIPGTALFQRYARCPWEIVVPGNPTQTVCCRDSLKAATTALSQAHGNGVDTDTLKSSKSTAMASKAKDRNSNSPAEIEAAAMTLDRTNEPGFEGIINIDPSRIVALDGIVLEEGPGGAGIASVLIC